MNFAKINGYPYVIHSCGTILRIWKGWTKELKWCENQQYPYVKICKNSKHKKLYQHRILAIAFIPNPENKPEVDHINGNKHDNRLENLRWTTHKENMNGFMSNRGVVVKITKGGICKNHASWIWTYRMSGKEKTKTMKSKEDLEKYRKEKLAEYNIEC
tara:strand:- start:166 stop:639 length:474 start_codon:yes stop_codon:yes gene_type:complete